MPHTVILRHDGIVRYYHCSCYFDAVILQDALTARYHAHCVELWKGDTRL